MQNKFWKNKSLENFTEEEWESICSHCGKCCLIKLQDDETEEIFYTNLVCKYFNHKTCKCNEYKNRRILVPECLKLDIFNIDKINWMPKTCSYRTLVETGDLPNWHPLISGKPLTKKHNIKDKCICQTRVEEEDWEDFIVDEVFL